MRQPGGRGRNHQRPGAAAVTGRQGGIGDGVHAGWQGSRWGGWQQRCACQQDHGPTQRPAMRWRAVGWRAMGWRTSQPQPMGRRTQDAVQAGHDQQHPVIAAQRAPVQRAAARHLAPVVKKSRGVGLPLPAALTGWQRLHRAGGGRLAVGIAAAPAQQRHQTQAQRRHQTQAQRRHGAMASPAGTTGKVSRCWRTCRARLRKEAHRCGGHRGPSADRQRWTWWLASTGLLAVVTHPGAHRMQAAAGTASR